MAGARGQEHCQTAVCVTPVKDRGKRKREGLRPQ